MQLKNKWYDPKRNLLVEDIVLITDGNVSRSQWNLGRVVSANKDPDGLVRKVRVLVGTSSLDNNGKRLEFKSYFDRPIHELVLLHKSELVP